MKDWGSCQRFMAFKKPWISGSSCHFLKTKVWWNRQQAFLVSTRPSQPSETGLIEIKRNSMTLSPQTRTPSNGGIIRNLALRLGLRPTVASLINRSTPFVMNQNLPWPISYGLPASSPGRLITPTLVPKKWWYLGVFRSQIPNSTNKRETSSPMSFISIYRVHSALLITP